MFWPKQAQPITMHRLNMHLKGWFSAINVFEPAERSVPMSFFNDILIFNLKKIILYSDNFFGTPIYLPNPIL